MSGYRAHFSFTTKVLVYLSLGLVVSFAALWVYSARPLEGGYGEALTTLNAARVEGLRYATEISAYLYVLVACLVFVAALIGSHRICGPVYRMVRSAFDAAGGDFSRKVSVRRKDHLQDTVGDMDVTFELMNGRLSDIRAAAEKMRATAQAVEAEMPELLSGGEELARLAQRLKDEREDLGERLSFFNT